MTKQEKTNPSRSFSFFCWDLYFKPEYSKSTHADSFGRARMRGYDSYNSANSSRLTDQNRYVKLYKALQRVFIRSEKSYLHKADEIFIYAMPSKNNPSKDICIIHYKNGVFTAHQEAYKVFDLKVNFKDVKDNSILDQMILNYLNHFVSTGEDLEPSKRLTVKKVQDPFTPKFFDSKEELQNYCTKLMDADFAAALCQDYFIKMIQKNNL